MKLYIDGASGYHVRLFDWPVSDGIAYRRTESSC
jgi:hypothetical protein